VIGDGTVRLQRNKAGEPRPFIDGRRIAFVRQTGGTAAIYVINADGRGERRLTRRGGTLAGRPTGG
jgi:Tol biopolymer transport system component